MRDVFLIGAGQTPVTSDRPVGVHEIGAGAIGQALADAGIGTNDVNALYVGNMAAGLLSSQLQLGSLLADYADLAGVEALTVEAACASGSAAARMAYLSVAAGVHDVVVVCGVEKLSHADRDNVTRALATAADWELEGRRGESFISLNAYLMRRYMDQYGVVAEDFAPFAVTAHRNALHNHNALFRKFLDVECYMDSRIVHDPLRLFDISPICDGAAAVVFAAAEVARTLDRRNGIEVQVAASSVATAPVALKRRRELLHLEAIERSTEQVIAQAGIRRADIDLLELHDAYTIMTVLGLEAAGFAPRGAGSELGRDGRIGLRGDLPISTFGGLKARGHPVGATGVYQFVEAYLQLLGRAGANQVAGAGTALLQNIGGTASTVVTHILRRIA